MGWRDWQIFGARRQAAGGNPPADASAARVRRRRSGGRTEVDRQLRRALIAVLDADYDAAEQSISAAAQVDSDAVDAYLALARLFRLRGEIGRSIRIHQNLLLRPDLDAGEREQALCQLARDFHEGGFRERAIAAYEDVLASDRRNRVALEGLAELLAETGDFARAIAFGRKAAKARGRDFSSEEADLLLRMARARHAEGQSDAARKVLKKAIKRDATNAEALVLLGEIEAERGKDKAALAAWNAAAKHSPADPAALYERLEATWAAAGKTEGYERFLRERLEANPDDGVARRALARLLLTRADVDEAISELRSAIDRDPGSLDARVALGRLLLSEKREPDARKEYDELLTVLESRNQPAPPEPPE